jgi:hypothetical protein
MAYDPQHPGRVALHPPFRFSDKADKPLFQILDPICIVNDGVIFYLIEQAING